MQGNRGPTGTSGTRNLNLTRIVSASVSQCTHVGFILSHGKPAFLRSKRTWLLTVHTLCVAELQLLQRCYLWAKPNPREGSQLVQLGQLLSESYENMGATIGTWLAQERICAKKNLERQNNHYLSDLLNVEQLISGRCRILN